MVSRRRFIESGVAGSLAGAFTAWESPVRAADSVPRKTHSPPRVPPYAVPHHAAPLYAAPLYAAIFDERFADAVRFGGEAAGLGLPARGFPGDVTNIWYTELHPLWKRQTQPLAGLTAYAALFCLERLAWDHGMRVVYHGEHTLLANGEVEHVLHGPAGRPQAMQALAAPDEDGRRSDWPAKIASLIASTEAGPSWSGLPPSRRSAATRVPAAPEQRIGPPLHSWVIAPPVPALERL